MDNFEKIPHVKINFFDFGVDAKLNKFPYIKVSNEENTAQLFLEAITKISTEHAKKYISKNFVDVVDLTELKEFFTSNINYKVIKKINFSRIPKNCRTNSMFFAGNEATRSSIINLHFVCEPDKYSKWKIYAIDQEL